MYRERVIQKLVYGHLIQYTLLIVSLRILYNYVVKCWNIKYLGTNYSVKPMQKLRQSSGVLKLSRSKK